VNPLPWCSGRLETPSSHTRQNRALTSSVLLRGSHATNGLGGTGAQGLCGRASCQCTHSIPVKWSMHIRGIQGAQQYVPHCASRTGEKIDIKIRIEQAWALEAPRVPGYPHQVLSPSAWCAERPARASKVSSFFSHFRFSNYFHSSPPPPKV